MRTRTGAPWSGDRRPISRQATVRRRAAEDALLDALLLPREPMADVVRGEAQTLLTRALRRLERQPGVAAAVAWSAEAAGEPRVLAALPSRAASRIQPTRELYDAIARLDRLQRLGDAGLGRELSALGLRGVAAVAPVGGLGTSAAAVLLVFPSRPGRALRPRVLAVLEEVASGLSRSMSTHLALERLARLDSAVERLDRLAALGGLVAEIVHEVRNPLVSVKTFLQLLPDRLEDPEFHHDFRQVVDEEVQRLERLLDDLLRHARPRPTGDHDAGARVAESIDATLQLLTYRCRERGVELESRIRPELPALALGGDALRQLLLNLLLNASQVTREGGRVLLAADWSPAEVNQVEIRVEDEGPGIDRTLAERIFEPFWTTRAEGAGGLGLAICKRIVDTAGGSIEVGEGQKGGACFRVTLPIER